MLCRVIFYQYSSCIDSILENQRHYYIDCIVCTRKTTYVHAMYLLSVILPKCRLFGKILYNVLFTGVSVAQQSKRRPPTTEVNGFEHCIEHLIVRGEFVNTLPKVVGFLQLLLFPPTGEVEKVGVRINSQENNEENCKYRQLRIILD